MDVMNQFRLALASRQIVPPVELMADGKIHRCNAEGKNGHGDAAYVLHLDGIPAGGYENHRDGIGWENWRADVGRKFTLVEEAAYKEMAGRIKSKAGQRTGVEF
jgi:putative DNA primase/helicase